MLATRMSENTKTAYSLNLPAITSCPGATDSCTKVCYANRGRYLMNGKITTDHNWKVLNEDASSLLNMPIPKKATSIRLLGSGDIFSVDFGLNLFRMCELNPGIDFWAYTRSFTILREILSQKSVPANLVLWVSADEDNVDRAEKMAEEFGLPVAYMGETPSNSNPVPCPAITRPNEFPLTKKKEDAPCQRCTFCFSQKPSAAKVRKRKGVRFLEH